MEIQNLNRLNDVLLDAFFACLVNDGKLNEIPQVLGNKILQQKLFLKYNIK